MVNTPASPDESAAKNSPSSGEQTTPDARNGAPPRPFDRRHWAERCGLSFQKLRHKGFRAMYPFADRLRDLDGRAYHYLDEGEGEPAVMVHGNPTWSFFYRDMILALRGTHRCLVPDHMGCGLSEKPQKYPYTLEQHIANLETWLESTLPPPSWSGGKINLIVHDWGGPIGFGYAVRHPERIRRLVVMNTSIFPEGDMPFRIKMCRWPFLGAFLVRVLNGFAGGATAMTTVKPLLETVQDAFVMPYDSWRNRVAVHAFVKDIPLVADTPTWKLFRKIADLAAKTLADKPMLVQWGMRDWCFTPFFLDLWKKRFPRAEVDEYEAGHYLLEDEGQAIIGRVRRFLEQPTGE